MVKIYMIQVLLDYSNHWRSGKAEQIGGSGCVIDGNFILTNAHVVSHARFIQVRLFGKAVKYKARVVAIADEIDLAILTVDDLSFFHDAQTLQLGVLPELQAKPTAHSCCRAGKSTNKGQCHPVLRTPSSNQFLESITKTEEPGFPAVRF